MKMFPILYSILQETNISYLVLLSGKLPQANFQAFMVIPIVQPTRCTCYLKLFILVKPSTLFRRSFRPSSGAQNCVYSNGICHSTAAATCCYQEWEFHLIPQMHLLSEIIYSCKTLYTFRTVFLSIIRSSKLCIQQWYMSNSCCYQEWEFHLIPQMHLFSQIIYSCKMLYTFRTVFLSGTCRAFYINK
jgi:hypothetical protein